MNLITRLLSHVAPQTALRRAQAEVAYAALMHYNAATTSGRGSVFRRSAADADSASSRRAVLAASAHDLVRNTPFAARAVQVIANNVVGEGIRWKVAGISARQQKQATEILQRHLESTDIDADGRQNLYGLQRLVMAAVVESGEVLVRRRRRFRSDGLALPFQLQILEPDFIDTERQNLTGAGPTIRDGIEYDEVGRRVAYWLFDEHPGAATKLRARRDSRRVPASEILHIYRQDRPGQMRGVSWFAPVALRMMDYDDYVDAQVMRQKIAACFAAFTSKQGGDISPTAAPGTAAADPMELASIKPGRVQRLAADETITFANPPGVDGYDEFTRGVLREAAAALGLTYEALTGDLSGVNFSSARMGRMEMDRNIAAWQWLMLVPQFLTPLARWCFDAMALQSGRAVPAGARLDWTTPARIVVDPAREIPAMIQKMEAGLISWQEMVRTLGYDPEALLSEHAQDRDRLAELRLTFVKPALAPPPPAQSVLPSSPPPAEGGDDDGEDADQPTPDTSGDDGDMPDGPDRE